MDFDADGHLDLVSGSYDPGELYLFRGKGKGVFAAREVIVDRTGRPILKVPDQKDTVESFGSWMNLVDWDDDGDLDLLVGTFDGLMFLRRNEGTRAKPAYAAENEWVNVGPEGKSRPLRVPGEGHASPVTADWDGDGLWDVFTGSADGGVYWYRNTGRLGRPEFAPPVALVPAHEGLGYDERLEKGKGPAPGIRSQIAVTDYDGDGKLDVLLGDFCTYLTVRSNLSPEQKKRLDELKKQEDAATKFLRDSLTALRARFKEQMKGVPPSERNTPENAAKWQKAYQDMQDSPEYRRHSDEYDRIQKECLVFVERPLREILTGRATAAAHGYVWLFRRK